MTMGQGAEDAEIAWIDQEIEADTQEDERKERAWKKFSDAVDRLRGRGAEAVAITLLRDYMREHGR